MMYAFDASDRSMIKINEMDFDDRHYICVNGFHKSSRLLSSPEGRVAFIHPKCVTYFCNGAV